MTFETVNLLALLPSDVALSDTSLPSYPSQLDTPSAAARPERTGALVRSGRIGLHSVGVTATMTLG